MKIKSLLIGMLACTALVGCTDEDDVLNNEQQVAGKANGYMSVKLIMAESGSRATTDGGYDKGTTDEQTILADKSIFLFYDANGNYITSGQLISGDLDGDEDESDTENFSDDDDATYDINDIHGKAYITISAPDDGIKAIEEMLTVINYGNVNELKYLKKSDVLEKVADATVELGVDNEGNKKGGLLMTTAVYLDGSNNVVNVTEVHEGNIKPSQAEALQNPVEIYVERASAKVQVVVEADDMFDVNSGADNLENKEDEDDDEDSDLDKDNNGLLDGGTDADFLLDGKQTQAKIKILNWTVNNVNNNSYLVKHLDDDWKTTVPFTGWNNANDKRSYWAKGTNWNMTAGNAVGTGDVYGNVLTAYSFDSMLKDEGSVRASVNEYMYCNEQTVDAPDADRGTPNPNVTTILVAAQIMVPKADSDDWEVPGDLFKLNGVLFTENGLKNFILKDYAPKFYTKADNGDLEELGADDLEIVTDGTLSGIKVVVKEKATNDATENIQYYNANSEVVEQETINDIIIPYVPAGVEGYKTGWCYYQIPIEHLTSTSDEPLYGVVRNHWYKLTIDAVNNIGEAVYNPGVVIPQIPDKETPYYLATKLHVLSWHVVNQSVTLD